MIKGITEKEYSIIKKILKNYNFKFFAYGSRVKGDFTALSDLDVVIKSKNPIDLSTISSIKEDFDKSLLPYIVNIADFSTLDEKFVSIIKNDLTEL